MGRRQSIGVPCRPLSRMDDKNLCEFRRCRLRRCSPDTHSPPFGRLPSNTSIVRWRSDDRSPQIERHTLPLEHNAGRLPVRIPRGESDVAAAGRATLHDQIFISKNASAAVNVWDEHRERRSSHEGRGIHTEV